MASLEAVADEVINLESRLQAAEEERDAAQERARVFTPRPDPDFGSASSPLNPEAAQLLKSMIARHR